MSKLDQLVESYLNPKKEITFENFIQIVEGEMESAMATLKERTARKPRAPKGAQQRERVLRLPNLVATEISVGQRPDSEDRTQFELWMSKLGSETGLEAGGSDSSAVSKKITAITDWFSNLDAKLENASTPEILSYLMFLNQFVWMLKEFNASVAGFLWEPFLASLFGGRSMQVPTSEGDIADIKIEATGGLESISLKILNAAGEVKGSFTDLVKHFADGGDAMRYVVVVKQQSKVGKVVGAVTFYEFDITADNFFEWIGNVAYKESLVLQKQEFTLASADTKKVQSWLKRGMGGNRKKPGPYIWIRHAEGGKKVRGPSGVWMGAQPKWLRLALVDPKKGILMDPDVAAAINLQGIPADGAVDMDTPLSADLATYKAGGSARSQTPGAKVRATYEPVPGEETTDTKNLWGGAKGLEEWSAIAQQLGDRQTFFQAVAGRMEGIEAAPGYGEGKGGKQFHIKPGHYTRKGAKLGTLKITAPAVQDAFQKGATKLNDDLVIMFNAMADLSDNIGRFFLTDCGTQECSESDVAGRDRAGQNAIENSRELQRAVLSSISKEK